jgi:hypothetical protein
MSSKLKEPTGPVGPEDSRERASQQALLGHLFASEPARERRIGPWLIAALLHVPLLVFFLTTNYGERVLNRAELLIRPILTAEDNPPVITAPPVITIEPPAAPPAARPIAPPAAAPPALVTPGVPDPNAITERPTGPPTQMPGDVVGVPGGTGSLADRMAAPRSDPRLFAPTDPSGMMTGPEGARARLADRLGAYNDSIMAERLAAANATDWTVKDKDGKRWGVSPGKLHLGNITLPLPLAFNTPPGRRDEVNSQMRNWSEIQAQATRAEIKDSFEDRIKEIRKRKDRERAERTAQRIAEKKKPDPN